MVIGFLNFLHSETNSLERNNSNICYKRFNEIMKNEVLMIGCIESDILLSDR